MQFTINRGSFLENLNNVIRTISPRAAVPILSGIKLNLTDEMLTLTGSDTDISVKVQIPVNDDLIVQSTGSIALPARFFSGIVKKLPSKDFSFEVKESFQTKAVSEDTKLVVNRLDANNCPHLSEISTGASLRISDRTLREIVSGAVFTVATQENQLTLMGVNFIFDNSSIKTVATDSHHLFQRQIPLESGPQTSTDLAIPGRSLVELTRIIGRDDPEAKVNPGENQALFEIGNIAFYSRLLDGQYPDTDRLIPTESTTSVEFELPVLARSLRHASLLTHEDRNNVIKMLLGVQGQSVKLQGDSPGIGNVEEEIGFKNLESEGLTISFNPDYLREALRASITDSIIMSSTQSLGPLTVVPAKQGVNFTRLITPVRTF